MNIKYFVRNLKTATNVITMDSSVWDIATTVESIN